MYGFSFFWRVSLMMWQSDSTQNPAGLPTVSSFFWEEKVTMSNLVSTDHELESEPVRGKVQMRY